MIFQINLQHINIGLIIKTMTSNKIAFLLLAFALISTASIAQNDWGWNWQDSSKVAPKHMPQYNEFINNQFPYPPKPRNQWELGVALGAGYTTGDVKAKLGFYGAVSLRKAIDHNWSARINGIGGFSTGQDAVGDMLFQIDNQPPFANERNQVRNYRNNYFGVIADAIYSINVASHYRGNPKTNLYVFGGFGAVAYNTDMKYTNNNGSGQLVGDWRNSSRFDTDGSLFMIGSSSQVRPAASFGAGFAVKVSSRFNIALEQRWTTLFSDRLDGWKGARSNDIFGGTAFRLNFNL